MKKNDGMEKELLQALREDAEAEYRALDDGMEPDTDGFVERMQEMLDEYDLLRRKKRREAKMRQWGMALAAAGLLAGVCLLLLRKCKRKSRCE